MRLPRLFSKLAAKARSAVARGSIARGGAVLLATGVAFAFAGAAMANDARRDMVVDFGAGNGSGAGYLSAAAAAQTPPAPQYVAPQAAAVSRPVAPQPIPVPQSNYDVRPTPVAGYVVAPTSVEGYSAAPNPSGPRQVAELYAPQPLPQRLEGIRNAPQPQQYLAPTPAPAPAASTKYGRPHAKAKHVAAPKKEGDEKDEPKDADNGDDEKKEAPPHLAVDVSFASNTRKTSTVGVGVTAAVGGHLEESGVRAHAAWQGQFGCCVGRTKDSSPLPQGVTLSNTVLLGYEAVGEKGTLAGYVGADVENLPVPSPDGVTPATRSTKVGLQVAADAYYTPTDQIMMSSNLSFSTYKLSYYMRSKIGYAVAEDLYIGPEVGALGSRDYQQYRVGAHISGVKLGALSFGLAGGFALDRKNGNGAYAILDSRVTF